MAIITIIGQSQHIEELAIAEDLMRLIVQAIIITTPIGFLLTNNLGTMLLNDNNREDIESSKYYAKEYPNSFLFCFYTDK